MSYVHLHVHDIYSLLDGISKPVDLVKKAKEFSMPALARTNHGNIFNSISFYKECKDAGIKPIIGEEFYIAPDSRKGRDYGKDSKAEEELGDIAKYAYHLTVLAKNRVGYNNIKKLSTIAFKEGFYRKPRIDMDVLSEHKDGLIVLSGCLASLSSRYIVAGQKDKALGVINKLRSLFGEDFFLELMHHNIGEDAIVNEALVGFSKSEGIPVVLTNDSHYTNKEDAFAHEVALAIGTMKTIHDPDRFQFNGEGYWFKSAEEMKLVSEEAGLPEESISNSVLIASKVEDYDFKLGKSIIPLFRDDKGEPLSNETCESVLEFKARKGLIERGLAGKEEYEKQLEYELSLIKKKEFSSYFLIIADIIDFMRNHNIYPPIGRGSAGGSLVCYCLYITGLDPLVHKLSFSRFINEGRKDLPDIDTDISQEHRKDVIEYIISKYGANRVAQIVTFQSMSAKSAIDNVGRALGVPSGVRRQVSGYLGEDVQKDDKIEELLEDIPKAKEVMTQTPNWIDVSIKLEGNNRNLGEHAAGIVISNDDIESYVPLARDTKDGHTRTQYDMKDIEKLGLLKLDMLGLKTMDIIQHSIELVKERHGVNIDFQKIPLDDQATYKMIADGKYVSVFQYDSSGIRQAAKALLTEKFEHLIALNALYRPGPMKKETDSAGKTIGKSIMEHYIDRRHDREPVEVWHPLLMDTFKDTYGLPIYQESIMNMSKVIAGFTDQEADEYRVAIGKKRILDLHMANEKFIEHGLKQGHSKEFLESVTNRLSGFARYGWNKSHGALYSYLSYVTAYLERHYPVEYYTVLLNSNLDKADKLKILLSSIIQHGYKILPPHINNSGSMFDTDGKFIYMGILSIRQLGVKSMAAIQTERDSGGPFIDYIDFCIRMDKHSRDCSSLIKCNLIKAGAFNWDTTLTNKDKIANTPLLQNTVKKYGSKMPAYELRTYLNTLIVKSGNEYTDQALLENEKAVLNFYISSHPVTPILHLFSLFKNIRIITPSMVQTGEVSEGEKAIVLGLVESKENKQTKHGKPYLRLHVGDLAGNETINVWDPYCTYITDKISNQQLVLINGIIKEDTFRPGMKQVNVFNIQPLPIHGLPIDQFVAKDSLDVARTLDMLGAEASTIHKHIPNYGIPVILNKISYVLPQHTEALLDMGIDCTLYLPSR